MHLAVARHSCAAELADATHPQFSRLMTYVINILNATDIYSPERRRGIAGVVIRVNKYVNGGCDVVIQEMIGRDMNANVCVYRSGNTSRVLRCVTRRVTLPQMVRVTCV